MQQDLVADSVVEFYARVFERIFFARFNAQISDGLKRREVRRRVEEAADAASRSLSRFLTSQTLPAAEACDVLRGLDGICEVVALEDISNPRITPEGLAERLVISLPCPDSVVAGGSLPVYRLALQAVAQVLLLVGPLMAEWSKLSFATTFELPRRVVDRLIHISDQLQALSVAQKDALDEIYELEYRDYLLQRFHRIEAGTVRMTSNLSVDLGELFVAPRLRVRSVSKQQAAEAAGDDLASLDVERRGLGLGPGPAVLRPASGAGNEDADAVAALDHVKEAERTVLVGRPGSGKSTFLEWLQIAVAGADERLVLAGKQAIPLLLRVRDLDPEHLPVGADLVLKATGSPDRVTIMPPGWIDRRLGEGRVLLMLDGLDETDPTTRDAKTLPWLRELCRSYPNCRFLISSRPVGYPPGELRSLRFVECDLLDFTEAQVAEYTRHWCTGVRQARNEPTSEAREQGAKDGEGIVRGFIGNPYIRDLARNPLMLSAICLVNYFEGGSLPTDRAVLYRLCVEGLLHHWDKRRGIHSEFTLEEKLRACREVAIGMQAVDRAEWRAADVAAVFTKSLGNEARAEKLLEHVRYRTGLLVERRPGVFAFAHLTFQEYLAALAVHEGNHSRVDVETLVKEHADGRWREVTALYCGVAAGTLARRLLTQLADEPDSDSLAAVLGAGFGAAAPVIRQDADFRLMLARRIARAPAGTLEPMNGLAYFPIGEAAKAANEVIGLGNLPGVTEAYRFLEANPKYCDWTVILQRTRAWRDASAVHLGELIYLVHGYGNDEALATVAMDGALYRAPGPRFGDAVYYPTMANVALVALGYRQATGRATTTDSTLLPILRVLAELPFAKGEKDRVMFGPWPKTAKWRRELPPEQHAEVARLARSLATRAHLAGWDGATKAALRALADSLGAAFVQPATAGRRRRRRRGHK